MHVNEKANTKQTLLKFNVYWALITLLVPVSVEYMQVSISTMKFVMELFEQVIWLFLNHHIRSKSDLSF